MNPINSLQDAIRHLHGCESRHLESVPIKETFQGQTVWEGVVEVFAVADHPKAKRCYAWNYRQDNGKNRVIAVLGIPPVDCPLAAVRAAIAAESKK